MSMPAKKFVIDFKDIDKRDVPLVGGKNANLGEMIKAGLQFLPGLQLPFTHTTFFGGKYTRRENL